ncbi:MAG TPA: MlaD family protein [Solirubrobacteraceae bacterium]|nr:MlaD family protein [Solirubrobacteraceae bacterium]
MSTTTRKRRRRNTGGGPLVLMLGGLALLVAVALIYVAFKAPTGIPLESHYDVSAQFASLGTIDAKGADVRIAGDLVGQTVGAHMIDGVPTLDLQLKPALKSLPVDTTARIRPTGLLGEEYVDLTPGHSRQTLGDGALIRLDHTSTAEQLSDVLDALDAPTRVSLGDVIRGLGGGLAGRGPQLNALLESAPATLQDLTKALTPLLARTDATARLISGSESLMAALDPVRTQVAEGFGRGADALQPFATQHSSVARLLEVAPGALTGIRSSLAATDPVLVHLTSFSHAATRFSGLAPAALDSLTRVLVDGRTPLRDANTVLGLAQQAVNPVLQLTSSVKPILPALGSLFDMLQSPSVTLGRYGCDLEGFAANWRSFLGQGTVGQSGLLGPQTILRTQIAAPGVLLPNTTPASTNSGQDANPAPCAGAGGGP